MLATRCCVEGMKKELRPYWYVANACKFSYVTVQECIKMLSFLGFAMSLKEQIKEELTAKSCSVISAVLFLIAQKARG